MAARKVAPLCALGRAFLAAALLPWLASAAVRPATPLALRQTRYEIGAAGPATVDAPAETLNFLLQAAKRTVTVSGPNPPTLLAAPNRTHDRLMLAAPLRTKPGEYTARISATSASGEERSADVTIVVHPRLTVPTGFSRPPVILLNGWEEGITGECPVSIDSTETFGNLFQYLESDGVPVVFFFDNCAEDPDALIETLGGDLAAVIGAIQYPDGTQVPEIDLIGFSLGGLIVRAYLSGAQSDSTFTPPTTTYVRDAIFIATPNFGSFVAYNYTSSFPTGTQNAEIVSGSSFLWNLATWNQRGDDLRGVNALAIVGNAGLYLPSSSATTALNNATDGLVTETSASIGFGQLYTGASYSTPTQVVPYCHTDPVNFTNTAFGTFLCTAAAGIANVTDTTQETGEIVRSFLDGNTDWQSIGTTPANDPYLSVDGGIYFGMENQLGDFLSDVTAVSWGSVLMAPGGDTDTIYFTDFVSGTGAYQAVSSSAGTVNCGTLAETAGYFASARCKIDAAIYQVGPLADVPGRVIFSGSTITLTGIDLGDDCNNCTLIATPAGTTTGTQLQITSWSDTSISAVLPSTFTGLVTLQVTATPGTDAITIMAAAPGSAIATSPTGLQFSATQGAASPAAQSVQITNSGTGTLAWTAAASDTWITVTPSSGTAPSTLSVGVLSSGLTAGSYSGSVTVTSIGASNSPLTIAVALTVTAATSPASIALSPQSLSFAYTTGSAIPAAQSVQITNSGGGTLAWTATSSASWLTVSAASGTAPSSLSVSVSPSGMAAGSYAGNIQIASTGASNTPQSITVTLNVTSSPAALSVSPQSLAFSYTVGNAAPATQTIAISSSNANGLGTWTATSSVFWASVSPASGSGAATLTITANPANVTAGNQTGTITISAAGASGSPATLALALTVQGTQAAGVINSGGVLNGGSFTAGFASATWVSIFGTNLSARTDVWQGSEFVNGNLPTSLDGVSVTIDGVPAYVEFISPTQINVLAPDDSATGSVQVQVTTAGQASNTVTAQKQDFAPAWFTFSGGLVAAQHTDYSYLDASSPAQPGETILLYGTGFGPTNPATPTGSLVSTAAKLANDVQITIGGVTANVLFAGISDFPGLYQFDVTVPSGLANGNAAVVATIGGVATQTGINLPIQQ